MLSSNIAGGVTPLASENRVVDLEYVLVALGNENYAGQRSNGGKKESYSWFALPS